MLKKNKEMDEVISSGAGGNVRASGDSSGGRGMAADLKAAREADIEKSNLLVQIRE